MRTTSAPASCISFTNATVAATSCVLVAVMDWTAIGLPAPMVTDPIATARVGFRSILIKEPSSMFLKCVWKIFANVFCLIGPFPTMRCFAADAYPAHEVRTATPYRSPRTRNSPKYRCGGPDLRRPAGQAVGSGCFRVLRSTVIWRLSSPTAIHWSLEARHVGFRQH